MAINPGFVSSGHYLDFYGNPVNSGSLLITGNTPLVIFPMRQTNSSFSIKQYDPTNFDTDGADDSVYYFKQEDFLIGRAVTITKVVLILRDLGAVTFKVKINGFDSSSNSFKFLAQDIAFTGGNTGQLVTVNSDIVFTIERPQLQITIQRSLGATGPLSIVSAVMITDQEVAEKI